ncbi:hypothetical protein PISMIDRAFT_678230 [Pisolithus microcarpus 441]|uniref:Uncharacterized protein n=1 Tax=Pisolithus microcarpus 441 TaxID=765257 RepID=A0A0C9YH94_9AGAM|nr:hypothetical protein BKA83DRAFT_678230 [Pisolithus microcarpus]KIK24365.1 hypothetical protein PISMIDRAFT_678230 [Pisolithus microcarpus 441]
MGQHMDSRVIIHGGKSKGINFEMSNVCALEPGTEHDHEPMMSVTGSTGPPQPHTESPRLQSPRVN